MKPIVIQNNCTGYNISCDSVPSGIPIMHGTPATFPRGVPGFESIRQWRFVANAAVHPFVYMEAEEEDVRFVCVEVFCICPGYTLHLPYPVAEALGITAESHIAVLSVVTLGDTPENTTANLMSPLVINLDAGVGEQTIPERSAYPLKFRIWDHLCGEDGRGQYEEHPRSVTVGGA